MAPSPTTGGGADARLVNMRVAGRMVGFVSLEAHKAELAELEPKARATSEVANSIGRLLQEQGKLPEAEILYRNSLGECEGTLGKDHPSFPLTLYNLGKVLHAQKKLQQAEVTLTRSLVVLREQLGTWNSATLQCITTLGMCKEDKGLLDEVSHAHAHAHAHVHAHGSRLTPHAPRLAPHASRLTPHASRLTPHASRRLGHRLVYGGAWSGARELGRHAQ